jgi:hypothetical protein
MNLSILSFDPHQLSLGFEFWLIRTLCTDSSKILLEVSEQSMHSSVGHYHSSTQLCTSSCTTSTMVKHTSTSSCIACTMTNTNQCGDKSANTPSASKECTPPCLQVGIPSQANPTKIYAPKSQILRGFIPLFYSPMSPCKI